MKIVFCTLTLSGYRSPEAAERGYPLAEERKPVWDWLVRHGFDGIDLGETWFNFYDAPDDALVELGEEARSHGLEIGGLTVLRKIITWPAPEEVRATNRGLLSRAVKAAQLAGAPLVNMSISPQPWEVGVREQDLRGQSDPVGSSMRARDEDYEEAAGVLRSLARDAEPERTELTLELHQNSIVDTPKGMLRLIDLVGHPLIKVNPDLGNFYFAYATPEGGWDDVCRMLAPHTNFWHVKNIQRIYFQEEDRAQHINAPLGEGMIDYRRALRILRDGGFDGYISIELATGADPFNAILSGKRYLDEMMRDEI